MRIKNVVIVLDNEP